MTALLARRRGAAAGGGGPAEFHVGSFATSTVTGAQAIAGVGFRPKAIIFWTGGSDAASGTWDPNTFLCVGFTSGPAESFSVAGASADGAATSDTANRIAAKALTFTTAAGTLVNDADLSSFDADGFTLNWSAVGFARATVVNFLAIGGDGVRAKTINWTSPTAAGSKAVTGVGFTPDVVLHANAGDNTTVPATSAHQQFGFGAMAATGQWMNSMSSEDAQAVANTWRYQRIDRATGYITVAGVVEEEAAFTSMDADGFTLNFSSAFNAALQYISLALSGIQVKVGNFTKTTAAAPVSQPVTGVGFQPKAVLMSNVVNLASTTVSAIAVTSIGASDGVNERVSSYMDWDGADPSQADSVWQNDKVIHAAMNGGSPPTTTAAADLTSLDADGFTLNWATNTASAVEIPYLAFA